MTMAICISLEHFLGGDVTLMRLGTAVMDVCNVGMCFLRREVRAQKKAEASASAKYHAEGGGGLRSQALSTAVTKALGLASPLVPVELSLPPRPHSPAANRPAPIGRNASRNHTMHDAPDVMTQ